VRGATGGTPERAELAPVELCWWDVKRGFRPSGSVVLVRKFQFEIIIIMVIDMVITINDDDNYSVVGVKVKKDVDQKKKVYNKLINRGKY
jgi:hypothetical protein